MEHFTMKYSRLVYCKMVDKEELNIASGPENCIWNICFWDNLFLRVESVGGGSRFGLWMFWEEILISWTAISEK